MGVTLAIILLLVWAVGQLAPGVAAPATPTSPLLGIGSTPVSNTTPTPFATPTPSATPEPPTPAVEYVGVNLSVRAEQRIWLNVKVDGIEQFAGLLAPGEMRDFVGQSVIELTTGNGRGTRVIWNGRDQGVLGTLGEVVIRLWTVEGMILPTPTPTITPTATP
jgi:hypothetical protein